MVCWAGAAAGAAASAIGLPQPAQNLAVLGFSFPQLLQNINTSVYF
jgi:hypothetical protein